MKTILILDDEPAVRESLCDYFEDHGWEVIPAESGEAAMALLEKNAVDAAVVDIRLPGMDGNDFIRSVAPTVRQTAFVICTGSPEYFVPSDLLDLPSVSDTLFKKPIHRFADLEDEILRILARLETFF